MSRITITLPNELIDELLEAVPSRSKTEAVIKAIKDEIRLKKREGIKAMAGTAEFIEGTEDRRHEDGRLG
ncbi:MAG: DUF2191 domain-containing protein [Nitrospirae bacterium]|nr:DUF2191 domain-containing protein [Nitrospirota bacterium]